MVVSMPKLTWRAGPRLGATAKFLSLAMVAGLIFGACGSATVTPTTAATAANNPSGVVASTAPSTPTAAPAASCKQGGTVTVAYQDNADSLSPIDTMGNANEFVSIPLFDTLISSLPGKTDPQPDLATSWDISSDSLTYTFHLRPGVKFSNGNPLTADDILFDMNRLLDANVNVGWYGMFSSIKSFVIVDASTLQMNMKQVDAGVLWSFALPVAGVYEKKTFEKTGAAGLKTAPVGSGPFMLQSWSPGQTLKYVKNPYYWGKSYLDGVTFNYIPDPTARALAIESGEADIAENIAYSQITEVRSHPEIVVPLQKVAVNWSVTLNNAVKPFDEKVVRQALNYATPRDVLNKLVLAGTGVPSNVMGMAEGTEFWDSTVPPYTYDLDKAKALMAQSSVPNGFSTEVVIENTSTSTAAAAILQAEWAKIGVTLKITTVDPSVLWDRLNTDKFEMMMQDPWLYTSDVPDTNEHAAIFLAYTDAWKSWFSQYKSQQVIDLVKQADSTTDNAQRQVLYTQLQKLTMDEAPVVALLWAPSTNANSTKLLGTETVITAWWRFENVCFKA
jgi:peptide/nickel transport system substrate-binding protein